MLDPIPRRAVRHTERLSAAFTSIPSLFSAVDADIAFPDFASSATLHIGTEFLSWLHMVYLRFGRLKFPY
jgi:hypothetical protein